MRYPPVEYVRDLCAAILFPQTCIVCGTETGFGRPLCTDCVESRFLGPARSISFTGDDPLRCGICGRPLVSSANLCTMCRTTPNLSAIDRIIPLFSYAAEGQELLNLWKTTGVRGLSYVFAQCLVEALHAAAALQNGSVFPVTVVPVPPRPKKLREKGWDQIEEICRILERFFGIRVLRTLVRTSGIQQKKLGRLARYSNLKGHVCVKAGCTVPGSVILVDDLMTTGSTLDACAEALKTEGCGKVYGLTLFFD